MASKDKAKNGKFFVLPALSATFVWRLSLAALVLLSLGLLVLLWESGIKDTDSAFRNGRRLIVRLGNGIIQGKQVTLETKVAAAPVTAPVVPPVAAPSGEASVNPDASIPVDLTPLPSSATPPPDASPALMEKTAAGMLPVIGKDGMTPWRYYAKPYERKGTLPMIAIVVCSLGENTAVTDSALRLPESIAVSFSPYAHDVANWAKAARLSGHEILLNLPLQPSNYPVSDPGPQGLLVGKPAEETQARLQWLMSRFQGYVGFVTPQNESFSSDNEAFKALLQALSNRGLMLVVGHEPPKSETKQMLESGNTANVVGDVLIDEDLSPTAIQTRLTSLEQIAKTRGYAMGIAQAYPITIQQLNAWAAKLNDAGFVLVPVTFITKLRFS